MHYNPFYFLGVIMKKLMILFFTLFWIVPAFSADEEAAAPAKKTPAFVSLGKPMVLNLTTKGKRLRFLQLEASVLVRDEEAKQAVEANIPALRHQLIILLSEQSAEDMKTPSKRNDIRKIVTERVTETLDDLTGNKDVDDVLFTSFLIQ